MINSTLGTLSIVSHGHGDMVLELLDDIRRQEGSDRWHVVLTLNIPEPELATLDPAGLRLTILENDAPMGFGANHNAAFEVSEGQWFAIVNPDIRMSDPDVLARLAGGSGSALKAPRVVGLSGASEDSVRRNLTLPSLVVRALGRRAPIEVEQPVSRNGPGRFAWFAGMFLFCRRDAFARVGGFDERFFLYCEDYDLSARLYLGGETLELRRDVTVLHAAQRDSHRSRRHLKWHIESLVKVWTSMTFWKTVVADR